VLAPARGKNASRTKSSIFPPPANLVGAYGLLDVLDCLRAEVRELKWQDFPYLIVGHTRNTKPTSLRKRLLSSGDVYPITKQVTGTDHDVTDMHPYAEVDLTVLRNSRVGLGQGILSLHGTPDGIHSATELREHAVACGVGYAAPVRPNEPIQDFPARGKGVRVATSSAPMRRL
jgi:hypothetical protein